MPGFAIILGFDLLGLVLHAVGVPLPAHVLGMILLAAALFAGWVKLEWIENAAGFLLKNMLLFFVPTIVGIITYSTMLRDNWLALGGGILASVLSTFLVTGLLAERLLRKRQAPP